MRWWWAPTSPPKHSDDEITRRVDEMVATGKIRPELAQQYERVLRQTADGEAVEMNSLLRSVPKPRFPKPRD